MINHLRAIGLLVILSLILCAVVYPLTLLGLGQLLAPRQSNGSLMVHDGKVVGSLQIAQEFTQPQYFWSRPSAIGYKANASGGSNLAASNPQLRDRVVHGVAALLCERDVTLANEVELWARQLNQPLITWFKKNPILASNWLDDNKDAVSDWMKQNAPDQTDFYAAFALKHPGAWPKLVEDKQGDGVTKRILASTEGRDLQVAFFDMWLKAHPERSADLKTPVLADGVTTSGSGLDPHITLRNAESQVTRVVKEWQKLKPGVADRVESVIRKAIDQLAQKHLFGEEKLVNVLELNLSLEKEFAR